MEGERILQSLKDGTNVGDLVRDLEVCRWLSSSMIVVQCEDKSEAAGLNLI